MRVCYTSAIRYTYTRTYTHHKTQNDSCWPKFLSNIYKRNNNVEIIDKNQAESARDFILFYFFFSGRWTFFLGLVINFSITFWRTFFLCIYKFVCGIERKYGMSWLMIFFFRGCQSFVLISIVYWIISHLSFSTLHADVSRHIIIWLKKNVMDGIPP